MAEIKIKIDSSDIDAAIAKVSHLLELVERLPTGMLQESFTASQDKVFISEALIKHNGFNLDDVDAILAQSITNSEEFEKIHQVGVAAAGVRGDLTEIEAEMLKLQRDAHHRFDAKLDNIAASLKVNVQKTAKEAISAACRPGGTIWQVFTNYR